MTLTDHALEHADRGWPVFPVEFVLEPDGKVRKRPHRLLGPEGGHHHGTLKRDVIRGWWGQDPDAGIGSAASLAADVDTDGARAVARRLGLRAGAIVATPNGHHAHFAPASGRLRGQVDELLLRLPGRGWTVMPGSSGPAGPYRWVGEGPPRLAELPTLPAAALEALTIPERPPRPRPTPGSFVLTPGLERHIERHLERLAGAPEGTRHHVLVNVAAHLQRLELERGMEPGTLEQPVTDAAIASGLPEAEVREVVDWTWSVTA